MSFHMGYVGYAKLGATVVRIQSSSLNPVQAINSPELVGGEFNKRAWNYGAIETGGNITGPLGESTSLSLAQLAWNRHADGDKMADTITVEIYFYKGSAGGGRSFAGCQVGSFALSVTAGDVATFTAEFMGTQVTALGNGGYTDLACEKLVTWDKCGVVFSAGGEVANEAIQAWNMNINNNLKRIQRIGQPNLFPVEILAGMRDVTGTMSVYATDFNEALLTTTGAPPYFGADSYDAYDAATPVTVTFQAGALISIPLKAYFGRSEINAGTDTSIYNLNFTGLCNDYNTTL